MSKPPSEPISAAVRIAVHGRSADGKPERGYISPPNAS